MKKETLTIQPDVDAVFELGFCPTPAAIDELVERFEQNTRQRTLFKVNLASSFGSYEDYYQHTRAIQNFLKFLRKYHVKIECVVCSTAPHGPISLTSGELIMEGPGYRWNDFFDDPVVFTSEHFIDWTGVCENITINRMTPDGATTVICHNIITTCRLCVHKSTIDEFEEEIEGARFTTPFSSNKWHIDIPFASMMHISFRAA